MEIDWSEDNDRFLKNGSDSGYQVIRSGTSNVNEDHRNLATGTGEVFGFLTKVTKFVWKIACQMERKIW